MRGTTAVKGREEWVRERRGAKRTDALIAGARGGHKTDKAGEVVLSVRGAQAKSGVSAGRMCRARAVAPANGEAPAGRDLAEARGHVRTPHLREIATARGGSSSPRPRVGRSGIHCDAPSRGTGVGLPLMIDKED